MNVFGYPHEPHYTCFTLLCNTHLSIYSAKSTTFKTTVLLGKEASTTFTTSHSSISELKATRSTISYTGLQNESGGFLSYEAENFTQGPSGMVKVELEPKNLTVVEGER